jgi:hypothetical protein
VGGIALAESLEVRCLLAHVNSRRNEVLPDETGNPLIRVHLGIQPSTATSHRRGTEVEEDGLLLSSSIVQHLIYVVPPFDLHIPS